MPERTEIEKFVRWLISSDILYRPLKSLGEKGLRRLDKKAKEISDLLKEGEEIGERVFAKTEKKEEEKARTLREGINAFTKKYPKYGDILEKMIAEKRKRNNKYLIYGLQENFKLGEEDYIRVMMDLGFDRREASAVYPHIIAVSERLGKAKAQTQRTILIS
ncbi:MAG: hypothetical protein ABIH65_01345 [Nanoarchaeota archaeon]